MRNSSLLPTNDSSWLENTSKIVLGFPSSWLLLIGLVFVFATLFAAAVGLVALVTFVVKRICRRRRFEHSTIVAQPIFLVKQNDLKTSLLLATEPPSYDQCLDIKDNHGYWWDSEDNLEPGSSPPPSFSTLEELQLTSK